MNYKPLKNRNLQVLSFNKKISKSNAGGRKESSESTMPTDKCAGNAGVGK